MGSKYYEPEDPYTLSMENELLALENRYIRSRLDGLSDPDEIKRAVEKAVNKAVKEERDRILRKVAEDNEERRSRYRSVPHDEYAELRKAVSDMRWLVGRIEGSPLRILLHRFEGWRTLVQRYGDGA